ncbi:MAG: hypothetical protein NTV93_04760 [Verrucomicrobia bacterium]|nr:hypothetical protein [Verrucomicrobiota bacterium]
MGLFHSGMNYWQKKSLSDRIHKQGRYAPTPAPDLPRPIPLVSTSPASGKSSKPKPMVKVPPIRQRSASIGRATKIPWPEKELLAKLLWEKPSTQIAAELGVSDTAIKKHCRQLGIAKPPRGYWAKLSAKS